ncbi:MAG: alcohol dehydrogenase catalytic domain-containing protein, partial [Nocardioidaceae bacterium]|nr:alcohol dehydrogenase catalytic domain-containing protein [Nocardioidaceae bacterium]
MRAVVQREYGGADKLSVREVPAPMPGKGEVLVRVHGAALDRGTWHLMTGLPLVVRPFLGLRGPRTQVVGRDVAGVVEAVGLEVDDVSLGDEVIGTADGSCADLAVVPVRRLAAKPRGLTFE